ncbi:MAG: Gfo/Idh/MocA family oxidoreductase [Oscillospiraceae bacterium]|nr:Gfo/Idh/MocA family oxidoreductase [Oscillospiraceae bacterium]
MNKQLNVILVGAGGYGETYVDLLINGNIREYLRFAAVVDPYAQNSRLYGQFKDKVPVYERLEDFFSENSGNSADLTIISSPIQFHYNQCVTALGHGSHVLCEKPLVPTLEQYDLLEKKIQISGKTLSVGFQWCYSEVMLELKKRILSGEFGKPVCFKSFVSWPRDWHYYARSGGWAGKINSVGGEPICDSVASNATAHYIQNMLFLLGGTMEESADLKNTSVECYKANDIESFDTIAFRGEANGTEIFYVASHAVNYQINPVMYYDFEEASALVNVFNEDFQCNIHHRNGTVENLGNAIANGERNKLLYTAQSILGERDFVCTARTVRPFTAFIDFVFNRIPFRVFADEFVVKDEKTEHTYVKNLHLDLARCFSLGKLPSELALPWAKAPAFH